MLSARNKLATSAMRTLQAGFGAVTSVANKHTLPDLPYDYSALEPVICRDIMHLHHTKHHATYIANLNAAEEKLAVAVAKGDVKQQIILGNQIKFNGGGHINHKILWQNLTNCCTKPDANLEQAINARFGCLDGLKSELTALAIGVQGSGWGWLAYNPKTKGIDLAACALQDPLEPTTGLIPLLGIDVWEHAYYLQYKNVRGDYVKAIFDVVNWKDVSERLAKAQCP